MADADNSWREPWSHRPDGSIRHASGLAFLVDFGAVNIFEDYGTVVVDRQSLMKWHAYGLSRGVSLDEMTSRQQQLAREAARWHLEQTYGGARSLRSAIDDDGRSIGTGEMPTRQRSAENRASVVSKEKGPEFSSPSP